MNINKDSIVTSVYPGNQSMNIYDCLPSLLGQIKFVWGYISCEQCRTKITPKCTTVIIGYPLIILKGIESLIIHISVCYVFKQQMPMKIVKMLQRQCLQEHIR